MFVGWNEQIREQQQTGARVKRAERSTNSTESSQKESKKSKWFTGSLVAWLIVVAAFCFLLGFTISAYLFEQVHGAFLLDLSVTLSLPNRSSPFLVPSVMLVKSIYLLVLPFFVNGFFLTQRSATLRPSRVMLYQRSNAWNFGEEDSFDVEAIRRRLETLVDHGSTGNNNPTAFRTKSRFDLPETPSAAISPPLNVVLPPPPLMTSVERARRLAEQDLLAQLTEGDDALTDLWDSWFNERGADAAARLLRAEELTGEGPNAWPQAEEILFALMKEHGVYWAEPVNRLATLYYMQGRFEESEILCQTVLAVKPWHFGALSGIVMVYAGLHDSEKARQWAARRLPTFSPTGPNKRRVHWVETALKDSQAALEHGEQRIREWMGPEDDYDALNSAWQ